MDRDLDGHPGPTVKVRGTVAMVQTALHPSSPPEAPVGEQGQVRFAPAG